VGGVGGFAPGVSPEGGVGRVGGVGRDEPDNLNGDAFAKESINDAPPVLFVSMHFIRLSIPLRNSKHLL
jgi:hypothetical protein